MKRWPTAVGTVVLLAVAVLLSKQPETTAIPGKGTVGSLPVALGALYPAVTRYGDVVAFTYQGAICTVPTSGGDITRLTSQPGYDLEPTWSPDGSLIAFSRSPNRAGGNLTVINAKNGEQLKLPNRVIVRGTILYYKVQFHADGRRILGVFHVDGKDVGLAWYNIQTGKTTPVAAIGRWAKYSASQDGHQVFYTTTPDVQGEQTGSLGWHTSVWRAKSQSTPAKKIGTIPARVYDFCFSDDDRSLIVSTDLGGMAFYDLWNIPIQDESLAMSQAVQLTFGQGDEHRPTTAGRTLVYTDNRRGATELRRHDLDSGNDAPIFARSIQFGTRTGTLKLATTDNQSKKPIVARVSIERTDGKFHAPPGSLYRVVNNYTHFYCQRGVEFELPVGQYRLRAFHGPEFRAVDMRFEIKPQKTSDVQVSLDRWTHQAKEHWHCGENHIHANYGYGEWYNSPRSMFAQSAGEAIEVSNFMVANSDGDGIFDRRYFRGGVDPISTNETLLYWNQEFRSTIWGHMTLVNLSHLVEPIMTGFGDTRSPWDIPTNSDIAKKTQLQNGLVNYTHVAQRPDDPYTNPYTGKAIPIDVALGNIDSLDLNATYTGTVPLWHRLLNCGFHLSASAGTDCFLNRVRSRLPGGDRVYVNVSDEFDYESWIDGLRAGRTFVTNGPMLRFKVGDHKIGDTVKLATGKTFNAKANVTAQFPITRLELIHNGEIIHTAKPNPDELSASIDTEIQIAKGGWLAVRAMGPGHADHPVGSQYAHTSPIYFEVKGQGAQSKEDAAYFLKWIDRLDLAVRIRGRIPSDELKRHVRDQLEEARQIYQKVIDGPKE